MRLDNFIFRRKKIPNFARWRELLKTAKNTPPNGIVFMSKKELKTINRHIYCKWRRKGLNLPFVLDSK